MSINNKLNQKVTVQLRVWAPSGRITIDQPTRTVVILPHQQATVAVRVHAAASGWHHRAQAALFAPTGQPLPGPTAQLTVDATRFGTLATVIIAVACGVFLITAAARAVRRRNRAGGTADGGSGAGPGADAGRVDCAG